MGSIKKAVKSLAEGLKLLGQRAFEATALFDTAGGFMVAGLAPQFEGRNGADAKAEYETAIRDLESQVVSLWGRDAKAVRECIDVHRLCQLHPAFKEARIDELRPFLKLLAPPKASDGLKPHWVTKDSDAPGFDRRKVAHAVLAEVLAGDVQGPTAVERRIAEASAEADKLALDTASKFEREQTATIRAGKKASKDQADRTRVETKAKALGLEVGSVSPQSIAQKLAENVEFRDAVAQALVAFSAKFDTASPLAKFETVMASFEAIAVQHAG